MNPLKTTGGGRGGSGGSKRGGGGGGGKKPGKGGSGRKNSGTKKGGGDGGERGAPDADVDHDQDQENYPFPFEENLLPIGPPDSDGEDLYNITAWRVYLDRLGLSEYAVGRMMWIKNNGLSVERRDELFELMFLLIVMLSTEKRQDHIGRLNVPILCITMNRLTDMRRINPEVVQDFGEELQVADVRATVAALKSRSI